jgi:hypothetical protein
LNRETLRRLDEAQLARVNGVGTVGATCGPIPTTITTVFTATPSVAPAATCDVSGCDVNTTGDNGPRTAGCHYV